MVGQNGFERHPFEHPTVIAQERYRTALENEVARMIETIDGIEKARVIYNAAERKPLFRAPFRQRAAVVVTMKEGKELSQSIADTIIHLTAFARSGLDEKDVIVSDQTSRCFRLWPRPEFQFLPSPPVATAQSQPDISAGFQFNPAVTDSAVRILSGTFPASAAAAQRDELPPTAPNQSPQQHPSHNE